MSNIYVKNLQSASVSIRHYLPFNERIFFYNATIKPLFLYGGVVWSTTSKANIRRVFRLQQRAARVILNVKTAKEERTIDLFKSWIGCPSMTRSM